SIAQLRSSASRATGCRSQPITIPSTAWPTIQLTRASVLAPSTPNAGSATMNATPLRMASVRPPAKMPASIERSRKRARGLRGGPPDQVGPGRQGHEGRGGADVKEQSQDPDREGGDGEGQPRQRGHQRDRDQRHLDGQVVADSLAQVVVEPPALTGRPGQ